MAAYKLGQVIKMTRENLGITQEELSDGICSVETLSRIENGKQTPNRANFKALMERLGRNGERYLPAVRGVHMHILVKCQELQTLLARLRFQEAETVLNEIEAEINLDDSVNKQLILKVKADIAQGMGRISGKERRKF